MDKVTHEAALVKQAVTKDARKLRAEATRVKDGTVSLVKDPQFQTCTFVTSCGAVTLGGVGGAFGMASGVVVGGAAGVVPSLLTFGLSIPVGAAIGGGAGLCTGTLVGTGVGGTTGFALYRYRLEIKAGVVCVKVKAIETVDGVKVKVCAAAQATRSGAALAKGKADAAVCAAKRAASATRTKIGDVVDVVTTKTAQLATFATTTRVGVTSASAAAGGAVGGTAGGVVGAIAGATLGVIPAFFTLGMSIPVCAAVGMCAGTAAGGATGIAGGGAVGYGGFTYSEEIKQSAHSVWTKASTSADYVKVKASEKASQAKASARALVRCAGTGGTV